MHPSMSRAFQRHQEHDLRHPGSVDLITTKQNKLPSFLDRSLFCFNILNNVDGREYIVEEECVSRAF
jgi:hypothetical protein